ncbi:hypothetical protein GWK47_031122 [Chionoecetes opilio]|uniref:Uncharacterized protein n=1 Tax=Chionoecetes opilio TaxID=41210 RepID=A0A8J5D4X7_CHIOP|nr:hypothetical protein GWK47_031122 [Chionoecetes opilio]
MVDKRHSGVYEVSDDPDFTRTETGWCNPRIMLYITTTCSIIIYIIGSIITGVSYRSEIININCTDTTRFQATKMIMYQTPLVVVGPCLMSAGGSILMYLLLQWFLCRPSLKP